ncbi:MAG: hypothetical protein LEGION0403_FIIPPAGN_00081 [Legionella sp.]
MSFMKEFKEFAVKGISLIRKEEKKETPPTREEELLTEIRDLLKSKTNI